MAVEVKLIIGYAWGNSRDESEVIDKPKDSEIDGTNIFSLHDFDKGLQYHKWTGRKIYSFYIIAELGLLRFSEESNLFNFDIVNRNENSDYYEWEDHFTGEMIDRDWEGDRLNPIPLKDIIEALRLDLEDGIVDDGEIGQDLVWHQWAVDVLSSMPEIDDRFVIIYFR